MQRTFVYGPRNGLILGAGAASVDMLYALVAAIGMTLLSFSFDDMRPWVDYAFILMAIGFGGYFTLMNLAIDEKEAGKYKNSSAFGIGFALNLVSPGNIAAIATAFAILGMALINLTTHDAMVLAVGVGVGSMVAWWVQIYVFHYLRDHLNEQRLSFIIRFSGWVLAVIGGTYLGTMLCGVDITTLV